MRYIISRYGAISLVATSFLAGCWTDKYLLKYASAATAQLPAGAVQQYNLVAESPTNIKDLKEQPSRASQIMRYGYPGFDTLRTFEDFVLSYDRRNRIAHWVVEHLSSDRLVYNSSVDRSKCQFQEDSSIHPYFKATNADYKAYFFAFQISIFCNYLNLSLVPAALQGSGYDRGHLAAAGNHRRSQVAIDQTFLLCNMAPQVGRGFNRDKWNELEKHVRLVYLRKKLARKHKNVYVCTGPLFLPKLEADGSLYVKYKVLGSNNIAVPTHFFKVALVELKDGNFELEAYVLPNAAIPDDTPLTSFMVPLDSIERSAGFLIFDKLPKSALKKINGKSNSIMW
uniref:Endonuclease n=1 Tax=Setaria digitata TaxID=48799 RepID=A0A915PFR7_9BILA